jgi:hypothetical protein
LTSALKGKLPGVACLNIVGTEGIEEGGVQGFREPSPANEHNFRSFPIVEKRMQLNSRIHATASERADNERLVQIQS